VKEFQNNPSVVVALFNEGGRLGETRDWLETFWNNYFLRGSVIFDENGGVGQLYSQPGIGIPFGRGFIIDQEGNVALPYFSHRPSFAIEKIYDLLGSPEVDIEVVPDDPPVVVPQGGTFGLTGTITNNTEAPKSVDVWTMANGPGKDVYGPFKLFSGIQLDAYQSRSAHFNQRVPNLAPSGFYDYIAYCGDYPATVVDSSYFQIEVVAGPAGGGTGWVLTGSFDRGDAQASVPNEFALLGNYPNPFNASTVISYELAAASKVKLEVYNLVGEKVTTLVDEEQGAGHWSVAWEVSNHSSGVYFCKLTAGGFLDANKMILLK